MMSVKEELIRSSNILAEGKTILYPTDTIAGLGCDATSDSAVRKVMEIKKREAEKSFIILVNSDAMLNKYVPDVPAIAWDLIDVTDKPLSIVYPKGQNISSLAMGLNGSIAVRMVKEGFCNQLIQRFGKPLISTSANLQSETAPQTFAEISEYIKNAVDYVVPIEYWEKTSGSASSIIQIDDKGHIKILRK